MERIEKRFPASFTQSKKWQALNKQRELLTRHLMQKELEYHKQKLVNLNGRDTEESESLVAQYQNYLNKYNNGGDKNEETKYRDNQKSN